jgi:hypothetical protein
MANDKKLSANEAITAEGDGWIFSYTPDADDITNQAIPTDLVITATKAGSSTYKYHFDMLQVPAGAGAGVRVVPPNAVVKYDGTVLSGWSDTDSVRAGAVRSLVQDYLQRYHNTFHPDAAAPAPPAPVAIDDHQAASDFANKLVAQAATVRRPTGSSFEGSGDQKYYDFTFDTSLQADNFLKTTKSALGKDVFKPVRNNPKEVVVLESDLAELSKSEKGQQFLTALANEAAPAAPAPAATPAALSADDTKLVRHYGDELYRKAKATRVDLKDNDYVFTFGTEDKADDFLKKVNDNGNEALRKIAKYENHEGEGTKQVAIQVAISRDDFLKLSKNDAASKKVLANFEHEDAGPAADVVLGRPEKESRQGAAVRPTGKHGRDGSAQNRARGGHLPYKGAKGHGGYGGMKITPDGHAASFNAGHGVPVHIAVGPDGTFHTDHLLSLRGRQALDVERALERTAKRADGVGNHRKAHNLRKLEHGVESAREMPLKEAQATIAAYAKRHPAP